MTDQGQQPFLEVKDLKIHFPTDDGVVKSVDGPDHAVVGAERDAQVADVEERARPVELAHDARTRGSTTA